MRSEASPRTTEVAGPRGASRWWSELTSTRFFRYGAVGLSGVVVNLGALFLLAELVQVHPNLASALAIETSLLTNFVLHERWTFADRRGHVEARLRRLLRFHVVSGAGALVQWGVFVAANAGWATIGGAITIAAPGSPPAESWLPPWVSTPVDTGGFKYVAQMAGIAAAMLWNYFANLRFTWAGSPGDP